MPTIFAASIANFITSNTLLIPTKNSNENNTNHMNVIINEVATGKVTSARTTPVQKVAYLLRPFNYVRNWHYLSINLYPSAFDCTNL